MTRLALLLFCLLAAGSAFAVEPGERLADPALEARARAISAELRCLVCQNESIDDSDADLAHDLRVLVRERLTAGDRNAQVIDYIVARYGDYVLLRPPFKLSTLVLWLAPLGILALAAGGFMIAIRRRREAFPLPPPLTAAERMRLAELLGPAEDQDLPR
jgi:cytochrome c-type biogenesis protein CcmH